jgi:hypothetical protein
MPLRKIFRRSSSSDEQTDYQSIPDAPQTVESEYQKLVKDNLRRWGIPEVCTSVQILKLGKDVQEREIFVALVRLLRWDRLAVLRLLIGLPLFETKVRKTLPAWLTDVSRFGGIWLNTTGELHQIPVLSELRHLVIQLTGPKAKTTTGAARAERRPTRPMDL